MKMMMKRLTKDNNYILFLSFLLSLCYVLLSLLQQDKHLPASGTELLVFPRGYYKTNII